MMKKQLMVIFAICCLASLAFAQTADEVVANYIEAHGGYETMKAVNTMKVTGSQAIPMQGIELPFTLFQKRPNKIYVEAVFQGMSIVSAYDGENGWSINPIMGDPSPQPMPEDQLKQMKAEADIDGVLMDYKKKGHQVEILGKEDMEGTEVIKLKVTLNSGDVQTWYLDAEYFIELRIDAKTTQMGQEMEVSTNFSDYKEVDGLMIPFSMETKTNGTVIFTRKIDTVEINIDVDDAKFEMPEKDSGE